jgi:hypothetical protein
MFYLKKNKKNENGKNKKKKTLQKMVFLCYNAVLIIQSIKI